MTNRFSFICSRPVWISSSINSFTLLFFHRNHNKQIIHLLFIVYFHKLVLNSHLHTFIVVKVNPIDKRFSWTPLTSWHYFFWSTLSHIEPLLIVNNDLLLIVMILSTFTNIIIIMIKLCRSTKTNEIEYRRMTRNLTMDYHLEQLLSR